MTNVVRYTNSHVSVAALQADANAVVANWTTSTPTEQWNVEYTQKVIPYAVKRVTLGGRVAGEGNPQLPAWKLLLTYAQLDYFLSNKVSSRLDTAATIQLFNAYQNAWEQYQCYAAFEYEPVQTVNNSFAVECLITFTEATQIS